MTKKPDFNILGQDGIPIANAADEYSSFAEPPVSGWIAPKGRNAPKGTPPIVAALDKGDIEGLEEILSKNPDAVNERDSHGRTPLFFARHANIAQILLNNGADVNARDEENKTPIFTASDPEQVDVLLAHPKIEVNAADIAGKNALHGVHSLEFIDKLLSTDIDVNHRNKKGETVLFSFDAEKTKLLLEKTNIDIHTVDNDGNNALHVNGNSGTVEQLIEAGIDVNHRNNEGKTPLDVYVESQAKNPRDLRPASKIGAQMLKKHGGLTGDELDEQHKNGSPVSSTPGDPAKVAVDGCSEKGRGGPAA